MTLKTADEKKGVVPWDRFHFICTERYRSTNPLIQVRAVFITTTNFIYRNQHVYAKRLLLDNLNAFSQQDKGRLNLLTPLNKTEA